MDCIRWHRVANTGYGYTYYEGKHLRAHRHVYEQTIGPIPEGAMILHKCDVKSCVNPDHLYAGTRRRNSQDAAIRGNQHKLTPILVRTIRKLSKNFTATEIAKQLQVSTAAVNHVKSRRTWGYVR